MIGTQWFLYLFNKDISPLEARTFAIKYLQEVYMVGDLEGWLERNGENKLAKDYRAAKKELDSIDMQF